MSKMYMGEESEDKGNLSRGIESLFHLHGGGAAAILAIMYEGELSYLLIWRDQSARSACIIHESQRDNNYRRVM